MIVNIHEAKTQFSKLVERAANGEEIIIGRAGKPVARLVAYEPRVKRRVPPADWKGKVWMAPDFDETSEEIIAAFEG